jgi:hypothetical protein
MVLYVGTGQKRRECGLKYVIYIFKDHSADSS